MPGVRAAAALIAAIAWSAGSPAARAAKDGGRAAPRPLLGCDALLRTPPRDEKAWLCYRKHASLRPGGAAAVIQHLERRFAAEPSQLFAALYAGSIAYEESLFARAEPPLRAAAEGFHARDDAAGEVQARGLLSALLCKQGRWDEVPAQLASLSSTALQSGDADLVAEAQTRAGYCALFEPDFGKAAAFYQEALARFRVVPRTWRTGPVFWLAIEGLAWTYSRSGRHREALEVYRLGTDNSYGLAYEAMRAADEGEVSWDEVDGLIRRLMANEADDPWNAHAARLLLAVRLGPSPESVAALEQALEYGRSRHSYPIAAPATRLLARYRTDLDPADAPRALALVDEALDLARSRNDRFDLANALLVRSYVRWRSGPRGSAVAESVAALDELDRWRDLQHQELIRAFTSAESSFAHQLVAGYLLDPAHGQSSPEDLEVAFAVIERNRARVLLDWLLAARSLPLPVDPQLDALRSALALTQKRLLDPSLPGPAREGALAELDALERDLVRRGPRSMPIDVQPPTLAQVQQALGPGEALLSFHSWQRQHSIDAPLQDGSSWVLTITRESVRATRMPDADALREPLLLLRGLIDRRDGSEAEGAAALYRQLVGDALRELPPRIDRLVIVPDGPLHLLPFHALRERSDAPPLGARYQISLAPSAALWLRWRTIETRPAAGAREAGATGPIALVLADPALGPAAAPAMSERQAPLWLLGLRLGRLPFARTEASAIASALDGQARVLLGADASERFLKTADLRGIHIIHFAAHAVLDEEQPERSAVVLAAGAPGEDGLLQPREIAGLDLAGKLVVLAACRSTSGTLLRGEGPLSLARSFFQAGAHAVVGSLWPLRDDESATLMAGFYRGLSRGLSVSAAMAEVRREQIRAGAPVASWAGMVVLGDGDLVPAAKIADSGSAPLLFGGLGIAFAAAILIGRRLRVRTRP